MTSVREDLMEVLRQYEEEERKRRERELRQKEEKIRKEIEEKKKENEEKIIQSFYEHLKQPETEGYSKTPYCDSEGKNTVGVGNRIPNYEAVKTLSMTSKDEPVNENNPAWDVDKKRDFMQKLEEFCRDRKNWLPSKKQPQKYFQTYNETMPYFQDDELEELSKNYIKKTALPEVVQNAQNVGIDFYHDLNRNGQKGLLDMQYNLGGNKFKLIDLEDTEQIDNSNLKYKNELKADATNYLKPDIKKDLIDNGYWPGLSNALKRRDATMIQKEIHRSNVSDNRNEKIRNFFANPWQDSASSLSNISSQKMNQSNYFQNPYYQRRNKLKNPWDEDEEWWY